MEQINTLYLQLSPPGPSATAMSVIGVHPKEKNLNLFSFNTPEVRISVFPVKSAAIQSMTKKMMMTVMMTMMMKTTTMKRMMVTMTPTLMKIKRHI